MDPVFFYAAAAPVLLGGLLLFLTWLRARPGFGQDGVVPWLLTTQVVLIGAIIFVSFQIAELGSEEKVWGMIYAAVMAGVAVLLCGVRFVFDKTNRDEASGFLAVTIGLYAIGAVATFVVAVAS